MKIFLYPLLFILIFTSCGYDAMDFQLNLEEGKEYFQTTSMKAIVDQNIEGYPMKTVLTVEGTMSFLVLKTEGDNYLIEAKYKHLRMTTENPQGSMSFDSKSKDEDDIFSRIFKSMIDQPFEFLMSKNGRLSKMTGMEVLWENTIDNISEIPYLQKRQIKEQLLKSYGEDAFKGNIEMVTAIFPEKTVQKEDKWSIDTQLKSGMSANINTEYSLTDFNSEYVLLKGNSTVKTEDVDEFVLVNGFKTKYDLNGTMTSFLKVDRASGWIIEAKIDQNIGGTVYFEPAPQLPNGMTMPMEMKTEMNITAGYTP